MPGVLDPGEPDLDRLVQAAGYGDDREFFSALAEQAVSYRDADAVELLMFFGKWSTSGIELSTRMSYELYRESWHTSHEHMGWAIRQSTDQRRSEAMWWLSQWIPQYLLVEESRPLARNMIHGFGDRPDDDALAALRRLGHDSNLWVAEEVRTVLSGLGLSQGSSREEGAVIDEPLWLWWTAWRDGDGHPDLPELVQAAGGNSDREVFLRLSERAQTEKDWRSVEILTSAGGWSAAGVEISTHASYELYQETWHRSHEGMGALIRASRDDVRRVDALSWLSFWVPGYLSTDTQRRLAVNSVHGLAEAIDQDAAEALGRIANDLTPMIARLARTVLMQFGGTD